MMRFEWFPPYLASPSHLSFSLLAIMTDSSLISFFPLSCDSCPVHMGYSTMLPGSHVITALSSSKIFNSSLLLTKTNPNCLACSSDPLIDHKPHFQPYIYYLHLSSSHSTPGNNPGKSSVHASHDDFSAETLCLFKAALRCHPL